MQIVIRLSDNLVQYSSEEAFAFSPYLVGWTFMDSNATAETHEIIGGVTLPAGYQDGSFKYVNGVFTAQTKDTWNAGIKAQLDALDIKRIRPTAEGDTAFLATLNAQALALRSQLK